MILLFQIYYYRWNSKREGRSMLADVAPDVTTVGEETPLLSDTREGPREEPSISREFFKYAGAVLFVFATGVAAWWISSVLNKVKDTPGRSDDRLEWRSQILGWTSAALYIGARIPQIFKNLKTRCEGLSPFLFLFSITGNATYTLSICAASMDPKYLLKNAGWLAGSSLTIFLDVFVLCQFFYYRSVERGNRQPMS
ncbi:hypothetical protein OE88DRAFT_1657599 [Heliocybe sulcata]|uniref:PQ-loop-domain-containing protein n=1 Tax=Heliocybe sulcata TaxID=5364 RepID=A0A5C3N5D0_9AGAM|nr:hypothetical protein OE88DRAFT_1657599 [Heliocybe sulcata]